LTFERDGTRHFSSPQPISLSNKRKRDGKLRAPRGGIERASEVDVVRRSGGRTEVPTAYSVFRRMSAMGLLTFALNVTLDGCNDHVGSPKLSAALEQLGLIDEYRIVIHPVLAGHGPTLFQGLERVRRLELISTTRLKSGVLTTHYRRKEG
jgi:hypothetical protein